MNVKMLIGFAVGVALVWIVAKAWKPLAIIALVVFLAVTTQ